MVESGEVEQERARPGARSGSGSTRSSLAIGVDVGGTKIAAGVVDESGAILDEARRETPATSPEEIAAAIADVVADLRSRHDVRAVGIGAAGLVDADRTTVLFSPNLVWRDEPLKRVVEERIGLPTIIENDANAAAWAEFRFGGGRNVTDMVLLTVGTGLGGGLVLRGELYRGAFGVGGEVGHMRVVPGGYPCGCGNRGCWEQYASGTALEREARALAQSSPTRASRLLELAGGDPANVKGRMVTQAAKEGDRAAQELLEEVGRWLGEGIASLAALLDPAVVVIGGGVSEAGELLLEPARAALERTLTARGHRPVLRIQQASLGNEAGIIGAADLARWR